MYVYNIYICVCDILLCIEILMYHICLHVYIYSIHVYIYDTYIYIYIRLFKYLPIRVSEHIGKLDGFDGYDGWMDGWISRWRGVQPKHRIQTQTNHLVCTEMQVVMPTKAYASRSNPLYIVGFFGQMIFRF